MLLYCLFLIFLVLTRNLLSSLLLCAYGIFSGCSFDCVFISVSNNLCCAFLYFPLYFSSWLRFVEILGCVDTEILSYLNNFLPLFFSSFYFFFSFFFLSFALVSLGSVFFFSFFYIYVSFCIVLLAMAYTSLNFFVLSSLSLFPLNTFSSRPYSFLLLELDLVFFNIFLSSN